MTLRFALTMVALLLIACSADTSEGEIDRPSVNEDTVRIGAFNFEESRLLAAIYSGALEAEGMEAPISEVYAPREIMQPALKQGHVDLLPEYVGTSLSFANLGGEPVPHDATEAHALLTEELDAQGVSVLALSPAEDANEVVVTSSTAEKYDLEKVSDLKDVSSDMVFGGSPECPQRETCLGGLEETYGLEFADFVPLDPGGPLTLAALEGDEIQAGILFSTSPALRSGRIVALEDDKDIQPPENIVPMVRTDALERVGARLATVVDDVSKRLSTGDLQRLNGLMIDHGMSPEETGELWLEEEGLL